MSKDIEKLFKTKYFSKFKKLLERLKEHPTTETGKPEQLKGFEIPTWSRRISDKYRLGYQIYNNIVTIIVIAAYGHYEYK